MRFFALFLGALLTISVNAEEPPRHTVRLKDGRTVEFTAHYDRNALRGSVRTDDALIALTSSGTLLRFDLPDFHLSEERIDVVPVTSLGRGAEQTILAGMKDGRICRVDPKTLNLTDVQQRFDPPSWIGWSPLREGRAAGLVVATRATRKTPGAADGWDAPFTNITDDGTGEIYAWPFEASQFLLDRSGRLWLGADRGEWGGKVSWIDLAAGSQTTVRPPPWHSLVTQPFWNGIYGFTELRDGRILAFGGTMHFSYLAGFIAEIQGNQADLLFCCEPAREPGASSGKFDPDRPHWPIHHVIEQNDGFLVFSYNEILHADRTFKDWSKVASLDLSYDLGRPDAMGTYPSILCVHPPQNAGEPHIIATRFDGYFALSGHRIVSHRLTGQFGAWSKADRIVISSEGILAFEDAPELVDDPWTRELGNFRVPHTWRLNADGWTIDPFSPPFELDRFDKPENVEEFADPEFVDGFPGEFDDDAEPESTSWHETQVLVGPGGSIFTVSGTDRYPGTRTTARWVDGKSDRLGREVSSLVPSHTFITPDGTLWNAFGGELYQWRNDGWEKVADIPRDPDRFQPRKTAIVPGLNGFGQLGVVEDGDETCLIPLEIPGPPWLLWSKPEARLWQLAPGAGDLPPKLTPLSVQEDGASLNIRAVASAADGSLIFAADHGLRRYDLRSRTISSLHADFPASKITCLSFDGSGRLWIGGEAGLWITHEDGKTYESFNFIPWIASRKLCFLAPDPKYDDGVIAALGSGGVMRIRLRGARR
jgi:hypothetical protein